MSLVKLNFFSKSLNMRTEVTAVLPEYAAQRDAGNDYKEKFPVGLRFPVLYFLNGFTGDYTDCLTMMPVERYAQETGVAVVMPSGLNSWYEDVKGGPLMRTFIAEELPAAMEAMLPVSDDRDTRFIGGLSMGGRGAAVISTRYPERYKAAVCLSAPLDLSNLLDNESGHDKELLGRSLERIFGGTGNLIPEEYDYYAIARKKLAEGQILPDMLYLFGKEDPLFPHQFPDFAAFAAEFCLPAIVEAWDGGKHDFEFWEPAMKRAMIWLASKNRKMEKNEV